MEKRTHIITAFDHDLNELNEQVQKLGRLAVKQFNLSIDYNNIMFKKLIIILKQVFNLPYFN